MSAPSNPVPRLRTLCTNAKHPRESRSFSGDMPLWGTANCVRAARSLPSSAHALHKNRRHLLWHIAAIHVSCADNVFIRQMQAHAIQTQYPHFQRLMVTDLEALTQSAS